MSRSSSTTTTKSSSTTRAATAFTSTPPEFWWSYNKENDTTSGYEPVFEVCGDSCSDCADGAKRCHSDEFSNICYEPGLGETCCQDLYGTACNKGFYCAYNDAEVAYCCHKDTSLSKCGDLFDDILSSTSRQAAATVVVTRVFTPSAFLTGTAQSAHSLAERPGRTSAPRLPTNSKNSHNGTITDNKGLPMGAKIGISVGSFAVFVVLGGVLLFFFLRRRRQSSYKPIGVPLKDQAFLGQHQNNPFLGHTSPNQPTYEPMRGADPTVGYYSTKHAHHSVSAPPGVAELPYHDNPPEHIPPPLIPKLHGEQSVAPPRHGIAELPYNDSLPAHIPAPLVSNSHAQQAIVSPPSNIAELPHHNAPPAPVPHPLKSNPHTTPIELPDMAASKRPL
ncbi:hypothetical protein B0J11DRAFT_615265 [Dendryphion nanum]|uniref:Uncharacterized protein n=1 Tax=Dendryphion nanum TaxID=256645 RepID=A0A9P9DQ89_9PLEO|nr:hypothetical protein B0J11DRAFT_615265 [Dendryphion nanum]